MRHFLTMLDAKGELDGLLDEAAALKHAFASDRASAPQPLRGRHVGMIFEKPSTRTRVSFEVGTSLLGGQAHFLGQQDLQLGRGESIEDTARVLSRYVDAIVYRCRSHEDLEELARHAEVPVINGLSEREHPCQVLADWQTVRERKGALRGLTFAYVGDGNNMCRSYLVGAALAGMHVRVATPRAYHPGEEHLDLAGKLAQGTRVEWTDKPQHAAKGADVIATDTWVSMGDEAEQEERERDFRGYTVDAELMQLAQPDAIFLHCLPAYYGKEVTKEVAHGPQSAIWDEAENRMWAQMALLARMVGRA